MRRNIKKSILLYSALIKIGEIIMHITQSKYLIMIVAIICMTSAVLFSNEVKPDFAVYLNDDAEWGKFFCGLITKDLSLDEMNSAITQYLNENDSKSDISNFRITSKRQMDEKHLAEVKEIYNSNISYELKNKLIMMIIN